MKVKAPNRNEFTDALDGKVEKIELQDFQRPPEEVHTAKGIDCVIPNEVEASLSYEVSIFSWSDGKHGATVKTRGTQLPGESPDQMADRINRFGVAKLREVETHMDEVKKARQ